jgi:hypothetical protein
MRRDQLEHAIRTACQIIERPEVIVVGSQAILGSFREDELPADATMSVEVDILPIADSNDETARLADLIEGVAGEFSTFVELHGFSIDGVDLETSALPDRWRDRLVKCRTPKSSVTRSPRSRHAGRPASFCWFAERSASNVTKRAQTGPHVKYAAHCSARLEHGLARWPVGTAYGIPVDG